MKYLLVYVFRILWVFIVYFTMTLLNVLNYVWILKWDNTLYRFDITKVYPYHYYSFKTLHIFDNPIHFIKGDLKKAIITKDYTR